MADWKARFLALAEHIAGWSKDPSTQVGAVIVRDDRTVASIGYNGFPRHVDDDRSILLNRELKYAMTVHADLNAILNAREPLHGYTMFLWPMPPCSHCAAAIIQSGIATVIAPRTDNPRWVDSINLSRVMFAQSGVNFEEVEIP